MNTKCGEEHELYGDECPGERGNTRVPRFGDRMRGVWASKTNPLRDGVFVRTLCQTGNVNNGIWYELTDGKGKFWQYEAKNTVFLTPTCSAAHHCYCGAGAATPHVIGDQGCIRGVVPSPRPIWLDPDTGIQIWIVDGHAITEYTLKHQRGFNQHECGCWSSWHGSSNSL